MINGILPVYKEKGFTSFDVVAKLRKILHQKKIGHTGTLDPDATGLLPICLGQATKLVDTMTDSKKEYVARMLLGIRTDTLDISGKLLKEDKGQVSLNDVKEALFEFLGESMQVPPMYSALKINGKKLYELARDGIVVEREARPIHIYDIELLDSINKYKGREIIDISNPNSIPRSGLELSFRVVSSKGTYIRSLIDDLGNKLGCGACMTGLMRTKASGFNIDSALTLDEIESLMEEGTLDKKIKSIDEVFKEDTCLTLKEEFNYFVLNGNKLTSDMLEAYPEDFYHDKLYKIYTSDGEFKAVYYYRDNFLRPKFMFIN